MPNKTSLAAAISLLCMAASLPAGAQVVDPTQTRSTTRVISPPPPPPPRQVDTPRTVSPPPTMPTSLGQRDQPPPIQAPAPRTPRRDDDEQRGAGIRARHAAQRVGDHRLHLVHHMIVEDAVEDADLQRRLEILRDQARLGDEVVEIFDDDR